jgi:hypothetical protein
MFRIFRPTSIFVTIQLLKLSLKILRFQLFKLILVMTFGFIDFPNINFKGLGHQHFLFSFMLKSSGTNDLLVFRLV